jgi:hypothetical protein
MDVIDRNILGEIFFQTIVNIDPITYNFKTMYSIMSVNKHWNNLLKRLIHQWLLRKKIDFLIFSGVDYMNMYNLFRDLIAKYETLERYDMISRDIEFHSCSGFSRIIWRIQKMAKFLNWSTRFSIEDDCYEKNNSRKINEKKVNNYCLCNQVNCKHNGNKPKPVLILTMLQLDL